MKTFNNNNLEQKKKLTFNYILLFVIALFLFPLSNALSQTKTSSGSGNWTVNGRWSPSGAPSTTNDVVISNGSSITLNTTAQIQSLTVNSGGTLTISTGNTLTITGGFTNNGTISIEGTGAIIHTGSTSFTNSNTISFVSNGSITTRGNFTNDGTFTAGTGTVTLNSSSAAQTIGGTGSISFYNLTISNSNNNTVNIGKTINITNNLIVSTAAKLNVGSYTLNTLNISNSGTLEGGSGTINASGNFTNNGTFTAGTGTVVLNSSSATQTISGDGSISFYNLTISNSNNYTVNIGKTIDITNNLIVSTAAKLNVGSYTLYMSNISNSGTLEGGSGTINASGNFTNDGTFTPGTGTVTLNGTSAQLIGGATSPTDFYKLTLNNSSAAVKLATGFQANITNELTINSGATLDIEPGRFVNAQKITNNAGIAGLIIRANSDAAGGTLVFNNIFSEPVQGTVEFYSKAFYDASGPTGSKYKWQFFGIPLRTLATANPTFNGSFVRKYNESAISPTPTWSPITNSSSLESFAGYQITQAEAKTITFAGTLENSDKTIDITYTSGAVNPGQHILANPYTAAIDITKISFGPGMNETIYFYNTGSRADWEVQNETDWSAGQYISVPINNAGVGTLPRSIPSMQGFLVRTENNSASTITFNYNTVKYQNEQKLRVSSTNKKVYTLVEIKGSRYLDKMWLFTQPGTTRGFDNGWDGKKIVSAGLRPQIFAAEHDGNYQVNTVEDINNTLLGFRAGEDLSYTLTFNHSNTELKYQQITLTDLLTQQTVDITEDGSQYAFVHDPAFVGARFRINSTNINSNEDDTETDVQPEKDFKVYFSSGNLIVNNPADVAGIVYLYDLKNQAVNSFNFGRNSVSQFPVQLPTGVYLAKASAGKLKHNLNFIIK